MLTATISSAEAADVIVDVRHYIAKPMRHQMVLATIAATLDPR